LILGDVPITLRCEFVLHRGGADRKAKAALCDAGDNANQFRTVAIADVRWASKRKSLFSQPFVDGKPCCHLKAFIVSLRQKNMITR
jgi:hypothetical protein